jgi:hypothetical protein
MTMNRFLSLAAMAFLWTGMLRLENSFAIAKDFLRIFKQVHKSRFICLVVFLRTYMARLVVQIAGFGLYVEHLAS